MSSNNDEILASSLSAIDKQLNNKMSNDDEIDQVLAMLVDVEKDINNYKQKLLEMKANNAKNEEPPQFKCNVTMCGKKVQDT